ncbi:MAG: phosphoenolpyruvate carboxylase [Rhodospirillales bacterium]|nr:phosphoenolpyruvate carboxylase [Rhodospirillales bacterium]
MPNNDAMTPAALSEIEERLFPEASRLRTELAGKLTELEEKAASNHLQSTTRNLALHVSSLVQDGRTDLGGLSDLVRLLTMSAFTYRARKLRDYVGECSGAENEALLHTLIEAQTRGADGTPVAFEVFQKIVEREAFGIVITAHPTFAISKRLTCILAELAIRGNGDGATPTANTGPDDLSNEPLADLIAEAATTPHGSPEKITLDDEMDFALMAIGNIRRALRRVYRVVFAVAHNTYPDDWQKLTPKLLTVATWVGYDLDGRADISWADSLKKRMTVEKLALQDYLGALEDTKGLDDVRGRLRATATMLDGDLGRLDFDPDDTDAVAAFSRALVESLEARMIDLGWAIGRLSEEIDNGEDGAPELAVLRAEMANFGLAFAHTHVRLNASQIANAIRHDVSLTTSPEDPANRRRYLRDISALLENVTPVQINFGSIMRERTSAKRLLMLMTQFLKFVDSEEPIRFLIAECNTAFTVLSALYFAKQFGIEGRIDISPLFETSHALEQGHEIIAELLDNPQYVDTIRRRGRLCIQTGYSDAGRFIGQIPASLALERTRIKLAHLLAERGLTDIEVVIFDTHGESIGRGAHPLHFSDRLDYIYPPAARDAFAKAGVRVKQEVSFQGGDGYVYFANPDLAFSTVCRLLDHALPGTPGGSDADAGGDPFYEDNDYSLDFFLSVKGFNERLMDNPDYAVTLDLFGLNLLYPTGSRNMKRQHEDGGQVDMEHPSQVRAIPHNAILQQLGYLSNSISGLGKAIAKDQDRFNEIFRKSDRLRRFLSMAVYARHLSDLDRLHGYISLFDPTIWIRRSTVEANPARVEQMRHLAHILRHSTRHEKMNQVYRIFLNDTVYLDQALADMKAESLLPEYAGDCSSDLALLHGVRIALIREIFLLIARMPRFSNLARSADDVINELLHLNIPHGVAILRQGFPVSEVTPDPDAFGEAATYHTDADQGYEREHRELFDPIEDLYDMVRRVGTAITHITGGVG